MGPSGHPSARSESGFTLVEIMVAISILLVGVLGVVSTVDTANRNTVTNNGRNGATSLLRRVVEASRDLPYRTLTNSGFVAAIQSNAPDLSTTTPGSWTVKRGGFVYTITANVCAVDDSGDGLGAHPSQDPPFCTAGGGTADGQPDDYRRVTATATWNVGSGKRSVTQVAQVGAGGNQALPSVISVIPRTATPLTSQATTNVIFDVTTTNYPSSISWTLDSDVKGSCPPLTSTCTGGSNAWNFTWNIGAPTIDTNSSSPNYNKCIAGNYTYDGAYQVGARGFDSKGTQGPSGSTPYTLNRCAPIQPPFWVATGRDSDTAVIDTEWENNPEGDIVGYRVYKTTSMTAPLTLVCPASPTDPPMTNTDCTDPSPPAYNGPQYYYAVVAVDRAPNGSLREGAASYSPVNTGNKKPKKPGGFGSVLNADGTVTLDFDLPGAPTDPDAGDQIDSFRIYRRPASAGGPPAWTDRYDYDAVDALCDVVARKCFWTDTATGGVQHVYTVTSVDTHLYESDPSGNQKR